MKCIVYISKSHNLNNFFSDISPYMIKIANKPILEYYFEFCTLNNIKDIRIVLDGNFNEIEEYYGDGARWGVNLSYSIISEDLSHKEIFERNGGFVTGDSFIFIKNLCFIRYDIKNMPAGIVPGYKTDTFEDSGILLIRDDEIYQTENIHFVDINTIKDYYTLNMEVLDNPSKYTLPGYSNEDGIIIGSNVVIPASAEVHKHVIIGDDVSLREFVLVDEKSVICDDVLIDKSTSIKESVILDKSYVGRDLDIEKKIISGRQIIDPDSGEIIDVSDKFIVSSIEESLALEIMDRLIHFAMALVLLKIFLTPYLIFKFLFVIFGEKREYKEILTKDGESVKIYKTLKGNFLNNLYLRLSLDKTPLLFKVFNGELYTSGNSMLENSLDNLEVLENMDSYRPAVFSYSEMLGSKEDYQIKIDNDYYIGNRNIILDFRIIITAWFKRLFE